MAPHPSLSIYLLFFISYGMGDHICPILQVIFRQTLHNHQHHFMPESHVSHKKERGWRSAWIRWLFLLPGAFLWHKNSLSQVWWIKHLWGNQNDFLHTYARHERRWRSSQDAAEGNLEGKAMEKWRKRMAKGRENHSRETDAVASFRINEENEPELKIWVLLLFSCLSWIFSSDIRSRGASRAKES